LIDRKGQEERKEKAIQRREPSVTGEEVQIDSGEILNQEEDLMIMKEVLDQ